MAPTPSEPLAWLHEQLSKLETMLQESLAEQAEYRGVCRGCQRDICDLRTTVFGNGKTGLDKRVDRIERGRTVLVWVAGALIGALATILGGAAEGWFRAKTETKQEAKHASHCVVGSLLGAASGGASGDCVARPELPCL